MVHFRTYFPALNLFLQHFLWGERRIHNLLPNLRKRLCLFDTLQWFYYLFYKNGNASQVRWKTYIISRPMYRNNFRASGFFPILERLFSYNRAYIPAGSCYYMYPRYKNHYIVLWLDAKRYLLCDMKLDLCQYSLLFHRKVPRSKIRYMLTY